jgi:hypothetical protein
MNLYEAIEAKYGFPIPEVYRRIEADGSFDLSHPGQCFGRGSIGPVSGDNRDGPPSVWCVQPTGRKALPSGGLHPP